MQPGARAALAERLRRLRSDLGITQQQLANALRVSVPLVSSWESRRDPKTPPEDRLRSYAQVFAVNRSVQDGRWRSTADAKLTEQEDATRRKLEDELMALRAAAVGRTPEGSVARNPIGAGPWHFPDGHEVRIVCAQLPDNLRKKMGPYTDPRDPDYVRLYNFADLDSLIELHGHIRAANPDSLVRFKLATDLVPDDYTTHLVLLGGVDWNIGTRRLLAMLELPVNQVSFYADDPGGAAFEVRDGGRVSRFAPRLTDQDTGPKQLDEDVAHFVRGPNPFDRRRTVTICNGMYGRGTLGAVRALTDARLRDSNAEYVRGRYPENATYSILFRVRIFEGSVVTPDWTAPGTVLHEWSEAAE